MLMQKQETRQDRVFTEEEVAEHQTKEDRVWVTYKDGVYDITDWVRTYN